MYNIHTITFRLYYHLTCPIVLSCSLHPLDPATLLPSNKIEFSDHVIVQKYVLIYQFLKTIQKVRTKMSNTKATS